MGRPVPLATADDVSTAAPETTAHLVDVTWRERYLGFAFVAGGQRSGA
jgi:hypothetical protein